MSGILQTLLMGVSTPEPQSPPSIFSVGGFSAGDLLIDFIPEGAIVFVLAVYHSLTTITLDTFTALENQQADGTFDLTSRVFYKVFAEGGSNEHRVFNELTSGLFLIVEGVDLISPFAETPLYATGINSAQPVPPAIDCPNNGLIITFVAARANLSSHLEAPAASDETRIYDIIDSYPLSGSVIEVAIAGYSFEQSGIATGTWTWAGSSATDCWTSTSVSIKS